MSWRTVTETDLLEAISSDELEGLRSAALASGQADPIEHHIDRVVDEVRGYIAANRENTLGPEGTVPDRLVRAVIDLTLIRVGSRVAGIIFDDEDVRRNAAKAATRLLENVASGKFAIEQPSTAADSSEQNTMFGPSIVSPSRNFTDSTQDGI